MCVLRLITNLSDADATLNAECGEECCDHAYDKLEYSLERFFVFCVTHGIRSLKLLTWLFSPATFGAPPRCIRLLPAFFVSVAKIQHPQKSIIRFYTFPAIRGYFIKFLTKLSYYTRNTHLPFAKQKLLCLATQPRMFESAGGNQKATSGRTGFSLLAPFDFMFLCHSTSFWSSTSSCFRAKRIIASTYPCSWPFPPAEPAESASFSCLLHPILQHSLCLSFERLCPYFSELLL